MAPKTVRSPALSAASEGDEAKKKDATLPIAEHEPGTKEQEEPKKSNQLRMLVDEEGKGKKRLSKKTSEATKVSEEEPEEEPEEPDGESQSAGITLTNRWHEDTGL